MTLPSRVTVVEVGPRDGLQNEAATLPAATRIALIARLADAGLPVVEAGAFVAPKWVPQMAGTAEVLAGLTPRPGVRYPVLVPNLKGLAAARAAGARAIAVFAAASDSFSRQNVNASVAESLDRLAPVVAEARRAGLWVRGYVSCALGCPYEGEIAPARVAEVARALFGLGCAEISLGDTIGAGTPPAARRMVATVAEAVPPACLAAHFHDTGGQALANLDAVLDLGIATVDSAVAGLGGCPYAPGASGNVATEDVVRWLHDQGVATGVDLAAVAETGRWIAAELGRRVG